jgi:hypothetical protein
MDVCDAGVCWRSLVKASGRAFSLEAWKGLITLTEKLHDAHFLLMDLVGLIKVERGGVGVVTALLVPGSMTQDEMRRGNITP